MGTNSDIRLCIYDINSWIILYATETRLGYNTLSHTVLGCCWRWAQNYVFVTSENRLCVNILRTCRPWTQPSVSQHFVACATTWISFILHTYSKTQFSPLISLLLLTFIFIRRFNVTFCLLPPLSTTRSGCLKPPLSQSSTVFIFGKIQHTQRRHFPLQPCQFFNH